MALTNCGKGCRFNAVIVTFTSLLISAFGHNFQSQEIANTVILISGGRLSHFLTILYLAAFITCLIPIRQATKVNCVIMTVYSIMLLICQTPLLSIAFSKVICCLTLVVILVNVVVCWLSTYGMFKNSAPIIISTSCYIAIVCLKILFATIYGENFLKAFFWAMIPTILYYVGNVCYLAPDIGHAYVLRQERINSIKSEHSTEVYGVQDASSVGFAILGFCFPIVGLILYCVWRELLPKRARSAGMGGLIGFVFSIILSVAAYGITLQ